jgi:intermediate peptidase
MIAFGIFSRIPRKVIQRFIHLKPRYLSSSTTGSVPLEVVPKKYLFGIEEAYTQPEDILRQSKECVHNINEIRKFLREKHQFLTYSQKLHYLDSISSELCNVIDTAELCRNVHSDETFRKSAERTFSSISSLIIDLNCDVDLYNILEDIVKHAQIIPRGQKPTDPNKSLTEEEYTFSKDLFTDYRLEGIHLVKKSKENGTNEVQLVNEMKSNIVQAESIFSHNIRSEPMTGQQGKEPQYSNIGPFHLTNYEDKMEFEQMFQWLQSQAPSTSTYFPHKNNQNMAYLTAPNDHQLLAPLLPSISNEEIRQSIWFELLLQPAANIPMFGQLLKTRYALANTLEFTSYSHKALSKNIFQQPEEIKQLLKTISLSLKDQTKQELHTLTQIKEKMTYFTHQTHSQGKPSNNSTPKMSGRLELHPWDIGFYQNIYQSSFSADNHGHDHLQNEGNSNDSNDINSLIKPYFNLENCFYSLQFICKEVFQLEMTEERISADEIWVPNSSGNSSKNLFPYHQNGIFKFSIRDCKTKEFLGFIYIDLFPRDSKYPGAAHFIIRCGCEKINWNNYNQFLSTTNNNSKKEEVSFLQSKNFFIEKQHPIAVLVLNYDPTTDDPTESVTKNSFLTLTQLESLYHEFGHALHSILSKTKFQHVSGTRGSTDYIEVSFCEFSPFHITLFLISVL